MGAGQPQRGAQPGPFQLLSIQAQGFWSTAIKQVDGVQLMSSAAEDTCSRPCSTLDAVNSCF